MNKKILILSVFVVASCGLAYELIAGAMSSYLLGDSILPGTVLAGVGYGLAFPAWTVAGIDGVPPPASTAMLTATPTASPTAEPTS